MKRTRAASFPAVLVTCLAVAGMAIVVSCGDAGDLLEPQGSSEARGIGGGGGPIIRGPGGGGDTVPPTPPTPGQLLFTDSTFGGNGRTCATCHIPPTFKINVQQIQSLPPEHPLFAGLVDLSPNFINNGLFQAELPTSDGGSIVVHRGLPPLFALGETAPYLADGRAATLQEQINGAVLTHFHDDDMSDPGKRMPTEQELAELIDYMLNVITPGTPPVQDSTRLANGEVIFFGKGQCSTCHIPPLFTDHSSHDIGVDDSDFAHPDSPFDPGVCRLDPTANDCATSGRSFQTRSLIGARHGRPFFHNNSASTLFPLMQHYTSGAFNNSPAAQRLGLTPFTLTTEEMLDLHAFLFTL